MFDLTRVTLLVAALDPENGHDVPRQVAAAGITYKWMDANHVLVVLRASGGAAVRRAAELAAKVHGVSCWQPFEEWREREVVQKALNARLAAAASTGSTMNGNGKASSQAKIAAGHDGSSATEGAVEPKLIGEFLAMAEQAAGSGPGVLLGASRAVASPTNSDPAVASQNGFKATCPDVKSSIASRTGVEVAQSCVQRYLLLLQKLPGGGGIGTGCVFSLLAAGAAGLTLLLFSNGRWRR